MPRPLFIYHEDYLKYDFGDMHVLREERLLLARMLMKSYGLIGETGALEVAPTLATFDELELGHTKDYLATLKRLSNEPEGSSLLHGLGIADNPVFPGMFEASAIQVGGTLLACEAISKGETDRALNIGGGFHHALPAKASGFCLLNDVTVGIKYLLVKHKMNRVMYVDIDAHHADGVEAAFAEDPRVLNISLHEDGHHLFPGTGFVHNIGEGEGEGYTVNVPLPPYTGDESYLHAFTEIVEPLADSFEPEVLITQLGADAHYTDPLAHLNLTTKTYEGLGARFNDIARRHGNRWIAVTGGGYDITLCPRVWSLVFSKMVGKELDNDLPADWMEYCRNTYGVGAIGATLRDPPEISSERSISRTVWEIVNSVKKNVFKHHGLG